MQTAQLVCLGYGRPEITVTWLRNGVPVTNTSLISVSSEDLVLETVDFILATVQLCSVSMTDGGTYTCSVTNTQETVTRDVQLTVARKH